MMIQFKYTFKLVLVICLLASGYSLFAQAPIISTWVSGDSALNKTPVYVSKGTASASAYPGCRSAQANWMDSKGNFWLFGGRIDLSGSNYRNDLWMYNIATKEWTWVAGPNTINSTGTYGNKYQGDTANSPPPRQNPAVWIDDSDNLWIFGGYSSKGWYNDLWKFDMSSKKWIWMSGSNANVQKSNFGTKGVASSTNFPGVRAASTAFTDKNGNFWLFGGYGYHKHSSGLLNDLWKFNPADTQWTWISGDTIANITGRYGSKGIPSISNRPGSREIAVGMCDDSNRLWLFGGNGYDSSTNFGYLNQLWEFDIAKLTWRWVTGSHKCNQAGMYGKKGVGDTWTTPGGRWSGPTWTDIDGNFWLFGSHGNGKSSTFGYHNDLWKFDFSKQNWIWMAGDSTPAQKSKYGTKGIGDSLNFPGARGFLPPVMGKSVDFWIYGGYGHGLSGSLGYMSDLWKISVCNTLLKSNPQASSVCIDGSIIFSVIGTGIHLTYKWEEFDGNTWTPLGSDSNTLVLDSIKPSQNGYLYRCIANGDCDTDTSTSFIIVIDSTYFTSQPVSVTSCENSTSYFHVKASKTVSTYRWEQYDGSNWTNVGKNDDTLYIVSTPLSSSGYYYRCWIRGNCDSLVSDTARSTVLPATAIVSQPTAQHLCEGSTFSFSMSATGTGLSYQWEEYNGGTWTNVGGNNNMYSGNASIGINGYLYRCSVTSSSCNNVYSDSVKLTVYPKATIDTQPFSQNVCKGSNTMFRVVAVGHNLSFAWEIYDGVNWTSVGGNSNTITIVSVGSAMNGNKFRCKIISSCDSVLSSEATLNVDDPPMITIQPKPQAVCEGFAANYVIAATGSGLVYQWEEYDGMNWNPVGSNDYRYKTNVITAQNGFNFRCQLITKNCGIIVSDSASLIVYASPVIDTQPSNQTVCSGSDVVLHAAASGHGLSYSWEEYDGTSWNPVGNNSNTYTIYSIFASFTGNKYRCRIRGTCDSMISNTIVLTVNQSTSIVTQPKSQSVNVGSGVSFFVSTTGPNLSYQWEEFDGTNWARVGSNSNTYSISAVYLTENGHQFRCSVYGNCATLQTQSATLTVINPNGIADVEVPDEMQLVAFPNPFNQNISIKYECKTNRVRTVQLFDMCGKSLLHQSLVVKPGSNEFTINAAGLSAGMYLLKLDNRTVRLVKE